jgi:hypothetical protein
MIRVWQAVQQKDEARAKPLKHKKMSANKKKPNKCLSCGISRGIGSRRYCSIECRQKLRYQLNVRSGLLKALNTRYATFYFTDDVLIMDVLLFDSATLYSFIFPRTAGRKPVDAFSDMSNILGNAWWDEMRRTNRKYLASHHVLRKAMQQDQKGDSVKPVEIKIPSIKGKGNALVALQLRREDLHSFELQKIIKSAYRRQVKKHHPDLGGSEAAFLRIHKAYEDLIKWAEEPSFSRRHGFPDKWFYDGMKNKWVQPTPVLKGKG